MEKYFGPKFGFVEVEVSSHQKWLSLTEVEMLSTAFFKSRYDGMTGENNLRHQPTAFTPKSMCLRMPQGDSWPPTPEDIPEPNRKQSQI